MKGHRTLSSLLAVRSYLIDAFIFPLSLSLSFCFFLSFCSLTFLMRKKQESGTGRRDFCNHEMGQHIVWNKGSFSSLCDTDIHWYRFGFYRLYDLSILVCPLLTLLTEKTLRLNMVALKNSFRI